MFDLIRANSTLNSRIRLLLLCVFVNVVAFCFESWIFWSSFDLICANTIVNLMICLLTLALHICKCVSGFVFFIVCFLGEFGFLTLFPYLLSISLEICAVFFSLKWVEIMRDHFSRVTSGWSVIVVNSGRWISGNTPMFYILLDLFAPMDYGGILGV